MPPLGFPGLQAGRRKVRKTSGTGRVLCSWCPATAVRSLWSARDWPASWVGDACPACCAERGDKADQTLRIE